MPKVELNLEDDELKELLLGDRDKAMQSIMAKILDEILKSEATEQIKAKAYERSDERTNSRWSTVNKIDNLNRDFFVLCHD